MIRIEQNFLKWKVRDTSVYFTFTSHTKEIIYLQSFVASGGCPHSNSNHIINTRSKNRCNEVFWTGLKIGPGFIFQRWILNLGYFFSVENWDQASLKIYPGSFFNSFANILFLILDDPDTLDVDPVENWPQTTEFWILIRWTNHRVASKYFLGWGFILHWLNSFEAEK
jgi:hypothetical protein